MSERPRKRWVLPQETYPSNWAERASNLDLPSTVLGVLWNRGLRTLEEVERFLKPDLGHLHDPFLLTDLGRAVDRVCRALAHQERILVFGDYDVDGITAAALWGGMLRRMGADVLLEVPNRLEEGYGLSEAAVERAHAWGASLLVANDCGTCSHRAVARAVALGIDVVVADHHMPDAELPPAHALVNPRRPGDAYPFPDLAAVGVAFKVLQGLVARHGSEADRTYLLNRLDLVALGTVSDVVPLRGENRVLTHFGLRVMSQRPRAPFLALMEQAGLAEKKLDSSHLAFFLAPRLNASGRLGRPTTSLDLLMAEDLEGARLLAAELEEDNRERRRLHERVLEDAVRILEADTERPGGQVIVLGSSDWHPGVLGIAASRLAERYRVPAVLVSLEGATARGSGRTPPGFDLLHLVSLASEHLSAFGGHKQAVGLSLLPERFEDFRACMKDHGPCAAEAPEETLGVDGALDPKDADQKLVKWLDLLAPFGFGNEEPLFLGRALCHDAQVLKSRHLRLRVTSAGHTLDCIGFGLGHRAADIPRGGGILEMVYTPTLNTFRGETKVQLKLREIEPV